MIDTGKNRSPSFSPRRGLTLLELLMVAVLLGVIAWVAIPRLTANSLDVNANACYVHVLEIEVQAELWYRNKGFWPAADLSDIGADDAYLPDGLPSCPVDGSAYLFDGNTHRVTGHAHAAP